MFGYEHLKSASEVKANPRACPVLGCETVVAPMTGTDLDLLDGELAKGLTREEYFDQYLCEEHRIYITPSTFIYQDVWDNLLWRDASDRDLLTEALKGKRFKAQLHHENSEDAVSWNIFRFLERGDLLTRVLGQLSGAPVTNAEALYWTYCPSEGGVWSQVEAARDEFDEWRQRASEPDVIVTSEGTVFVIEAKLRSESGGSSENNAKKRKKRARWYGRGKKYLQQSVEDIVDARYDQLMRFWVLGCWIAQRMDRDFLLVNLVRSGEEEGIEEDFGSYIAETDHRRFLRLTWEEIFESIVSAAPASGDRDRMMWYFENKTISCEKAFKVP